MPPKPNNTDRLAGMLSIDMTPVPVWTDDDLGPILGHQLAAPLRPDLEPHGMWPTEFNAQHPAPQTFADLLHDHHPPLALLNLAKQFAKTCANNPNSPLPQPVATTLYYTAIAAALVQHNQRITTLDSTALIQGLQWVTDQSWVDPKTKSLATNATKQLQPNPRK